MLQTLIIDEQNQYSFELAAKLDKFCPILELKGISDRKQELSGFLKDMDIQLVFVNPNLISTNVVKQLGLFKPNVAMICISKSFDFLSCTDYWQSVGYLLKPISEKKLITAVDAAREKIYKNLNSTDMETTPNEQLKVNIEKNIIGIPTIEGFEIIQVSDIARCEGLQKCTRIITNKKFDIVSSYSIGMFKKLLSPFNSFFSPHRSHIINMNFVKKYKKSGIIVLNNDTQIPIARNKKDDFLNRIMHF